MNLTSSSSSGSESGIEDKTFVEPVLALRGCEVTCVRDGADIDRLSLKD